jgi:hypothetical protein
MFFFITVSEVYLVVPGYQIHMVRPENNNNKKVNENVVSLSVTHLYFLAYNIYIYERYRDASNAATQV